MNSPEPNVVRAEAYPAQKQCDNCSADLAGHFCHCCGAPATATRDLSLRYIASEFVSEITNLHHSKIMRTLLVLCFRPGLLSLENFTGRRVRYLKPVTLVLAVFAIHLFVFTASERATGFNIQASLNSEAGELADTGRKRLVVAAVQHKAARSGGTTEIVAETINKDWIRNFSFFQIPLILFLALWTSLLLVTSRRHMVEHLVFGMHLISFTGLTVVMLWPLIYLAGTPGELWPFIAGKFLFDLTWVSLAIRRVYGRGAVASWVLGLAIHGGYFIAFSAAHQFSLIIALQSNLSS